MKPPKETPKKDCDDENYELAGWVAGAYGGRWIFHPINPATVFPDNTALFIRKPRR